MKLEEILGSVQELRTLTKDFATYKEQVTSVLEEFGKTIENLGKRVEGMEGVSKEEIIKVLDSLEKKVNENVDAHNALKKNTEDGLEAIRKVFGTMGAKIQEIEKIQSELNGTLGDIKKSADESLAFKRTLQTFIKGLLS